MEKIFILFEPLLRDLIKDFSKNRGNAINKSGSENHAGKRYITVRKRFEFSFI